VACVARLCPEGEAGKRAIYGNYKSRNTTSTSTFSSGSETKAAGAVFKAQEVLAQDFYTNALVFRRWPSLYAQAGRKTKAIVGTACSAI